MTPTADHGLAVGTRVHLKPKASKLLPGRIIRGGEGVVVRVEGDNITVRIDRNDRNRVARREELVIHKEPR